MIKRITAFLIDVIFFISLLGAAAIIAFFAIYLQQHDISLLNTYLQQYLSTTMIVTYVIVFVLFLVYFWVIPVFLKATIGQSLMNLRLAPSEKTTWLSVFLKNVAGTFWDIVLFPYTIVVAILRRPLINTWISGLTLTTTNRKNSPLFYTSVGLNTVFLLSTIVIGTYVYRVGLGAIMEQYTDYGHMTATLIDKQAFQDAQTSLEKYKQYAGENADYWYYSCQIETALSSDLKNLTICDTASQQNAQNTSRMETITEIYARLYASNDDYAKAETYYAQLWNTYNVRTMDMEDYVVVLSNLGKAKEATDVLTTLAANVSPSDYAMNIDIADLYGRLGNAQDALTRYTNTLNAIPTGTNLDMVGEINYDIGVILYNQKKYTDAKAHFDLVKSQNQDFAEGADSYIILINKLQKSIVK